MILERLVSFKNLIDIVEAAQNDNLKLREQAKIQWFEKEHGTTKQLSIKKRVVEKANINKAKRVSLEVGWLFHIILFKRIITQKRNN